MPTTKLGQVSKKWLENNTVHRSQHGSEFFFFLIKLGAKNYKFGESQIATISREPREELETGKSERKSFFEAIAYSKNKEKREKEV